MTCPESLELERGQPFATLKSVVCPESLSAVQRGVGAGLQGRASELEVYPRRYIEGLPAEIKDLCEGQRTGPSRFHSSYRDARAS